MQTVYKILPWVAGALLLLAVPDGLWPYAYYQALRWAIAAAGITLACEAFIHERQGWVWVMAILAIVFNPIEPFYLGKELWVVVDIMAASLMFAYGVARHKREPGA